MKIGILSFHYVRNYGAVLQNYALQTFINKLDGAECFTIDYHCKYLEKYYNKRILTNGKTSLLDYSIKDIAKYLLAIPFYFKRDRIFKKFISSNIRLYKKNVQKSKLKNLCSDIQCFISGSDQVFNPKITKDDYSYLQDFVSGESLKISYAASGCFEAQSNELFNVCAFLKKFSCVSVREEKDAKILKQYSVNACVNLDPTLLLSEKDWESLETEVKLNKKYVVFFELIDAPYAAQKAIQYARENKLDVVFFSSDDKIWKYRNNMHHLNCVSPSEFIYLIHHSECVFTNSYHGMMFSIIFHKPFFCQTTFNDKRMPDALNMCGLGNSYSQSEYGVEIKDPAIYSNPSFKTQLEEEICKSKAFLEKVIH